MKKEEKKATATEKTTEKSAKKDALFEPPKFIAGKVDLKKLLKAGVHFGHSRSKRDPRMKKYIFTTQKGLDIIDLEQTEKKLAEAIEIVEKIKKEGKQILFVSTKKQAKKMVRATAEACEMPFVDERWLGGTFTNFKEIKKRAQYLKDSQEKMEKGEFDKYTKLEKLKKTEELEKLERKMGGLKRMSELPGAIFIVDIKTDKIALREATQVKVPIIAMTDTNVNPETVDYPIPANDDAVSSIKLILGYIGGAIVK